MVKKKELDNLLIQFMKQEGSIRVIALVDREGLPVSYGIKSRKDRIKPKTLGSLVRQSYHPMRLYASKLNLLSPMFQIYIMEDGCIFEVDMGYVILAVLFDKVYWPLDAESFYNLLINIHSKLDQISKEPNSQLKGIIEAKESKINLISDDDLSSLMRIINSLDSGNLTSIDISIPEDIQSVEQPMPFIGNKMDCFLVDETKQIRYNNPDYHQFGDFSSNIISIEEEGLSLFNSGRFLAAFSYFKDGVILSNAVIGGVDGTDVFMFKKHDGFQKFKKLISPYYSLINLLLDNFPSKRAASLVNLIVFLTEPIEALKEHAQYHAKNRNLKVASSFMERGAIILIRQDKMEQAGDLYKTIGLLVVKNKKYDEGLKYFDQAMSLYGEAEAYTKSGKLGMLMAKIFLKIRDVNGAISSYSKAELAYESGNHTDLVKGVKKSKNDLLQDLSKKLKKYIKESASPIITFNFLSEKLKLENAYIILVLKKMINDGELTGTLEIPNERYLKGQGAAHGTIKEAGGSGTDESDYEEITRDEIQAIDTPQQVELDESEIEREYTEFDNIYLVEGAPKSFHLKRLDRDTYLAVIFSQYPSKTFRDNIDRFADKLVKRSKILKSNPSYIDTVIDNYFAHPKDLALKNKSRDEEDGMKVCPICGTRNLSEAKYCSKDHVKLVF